MAKFLCQYFSSFNRKESEAEMCWEQNPRNQRENVKLIFSKGNVNIHLRKVNQRRLQDLKGFAPWGQGTSRDVSRGHLADFADQVPLPKC